MIGVIVGARKIGINPDNVATPIAASLGDLITLALLSSISWGLYKQMREWSPCLFRKVSYHKSISIVKTREIWYGTSIRKLQSYCAV